MAICDTCVNLAADLVTSGEPAEDSRTALDPASPAGPRSFCGRAIAAEPPAAAVATATICVECVELYREIVVEEQQV